MDKLNLLSSFFVETPLSHRDGITPTLPFASPFAMGEGQGKGEMGLYKRSLEKGESQEHRSIFLSLGTFHLTVPIKARGSSHPPVQANSYGGPGPLYSGVSGFYEI